MKKGEILLFIAAFIWGSAFVAQSIAMDDIEPWTFNFLRSVVAIITLLILIPFSNREKKTEKEDSRLLIRGGIICGIFLSAASILQQFGISLTTAGKSAFITALYVVLVPVFGAVMGKKVKMNIWISAALAVAGLYFLSINGSFSLERADILLIGCAVCFAFQIMAVDHYSPYVNGMKLSLVQFVVMAGVSFFPMLIFEHPDFSNIVQAIVPILYTGVLSSGVAYTLQIIGQKYTAPAIASLIMSFESVFAAISGFVILHETLSGRELFGCALMLIAIILAEANDIFKKKSLSQQ